MPGAPQKRTLRRDFAEKRGDDYVEKRQRTDEGWQKTTVTSSAAFEEYYKAQGICPPEVRVLPGSRRRGRAAGAAHAGVLLGCALSPPPFLRRPLRSGSRSRPCSTRRCP